jgi:hypothetical protein
MIEVAKRSYWRGSETLLIAFALVVALQAREHPSYLSWGDGGLNPRWRVPSRGTAYFFGVLPQ